MPSRSCIKELIRATEYYWMQVRAGIRQRARELGLDHVSLTDMGCGPGVPLGDEHADRLVDLLEPGTDALIAMRLPDPLLLRILESGVPTVLLTETELRHPLLVSPTGFYDIARSVGAFLAGELGGQGHILIVGGMMDPGEAGRSRLAGIRAALRAYPRIRVTHIPNRAWTYEETHDYVCAPMRALDGPVDAIFGLTDPVALAARDEARLLGLAHEDTLVVGINGDLLALAAIASGQMTATIDLAPADFGRRSVDLASWALRGRPLPELFHYRSRLVTAQNVAEVTASRATEPQTSAVVKRAVAYIQQNHARSLSRQEIAGAVGVHEHYLSRLFRQELGTTPWEYLNRYRVERAKALLRRTDASITAVATGAGFNDPDYFSRVFRRHVGCSPREYRRCSG
jgi:AraC-like DNA-binding protein